LPKLCWMAQFQRERAASAGGRKHRAKLRYPGNCHADSHALPADKR